MLIQLPDGNRVDLNSVVYSLSSFTITFTMIAGGATFTYADPNSNVSNAKATLAQLDTFRRYPLAAPTNNQVPLLVAGYFSINSVQPNQVDTASIASFTVVGTGFVAGTQYYLCINDTTGGMDDDPIYYTCTFVNQNTLTAVFTGGASNLSSGALLYLSDMVPSGNSGATARGHLSNILTGTSVGGSASVITIP